MEHSMTITSSSRGVTETPTICLVLVIPTRRERSGIPILNVSACVSTLTTIWPPTLGFITTYPITTQAVIIRNLAITMRYIRCILPVRKHLFYIRIISMQMASKAGYWQMWTRWVLVIRLHWWKIWTIKIASIESTACWEYIGIWLRNGGFLRTCPFLISTCQKDSIVPHWVLLRIGIDYGRTRKETLANSILTGTRDWPRREI